MILHNEVNWDGRCLHPTHEEHSNPRTRNGGTTGDGEIHSVHRKWPKETAYKRSPMATRAKEPGDKDVSLLPLLCWAIDLHWPCYLHTFSKVCSMQAPWGGKISNGHVWTERTEETWVLSVRWPGEACFWKPFKTSCTWWTSSLDRNRDPSYFSWVLKMGSSEISPNCIDLLSSNNNKLRSLSYILWLSSYVKNESKLWKQKDLELSTWSFVQVGKSIHLTEIV